jgi:hypothetical protein
MVALVSLTLALATTVGTGNQEMYQILQGANGIAYGTAYLMMFLIPLIGAGEKPSMFLRAAAVSGFLMTLLNVVLGLFPIIDVPNPIVYGLKIGGVVLVLNAAGAMFYMRASAKRAA